jgi:thiamine-monophosphate kinase
MPGEFETIARLFAPLAEGWPGAFKLQNDAATLGLAPGEEAVLTLDTMTEGVHFLPGDPPELVAKKLLRVNLSDLAAMGAEPLGYLLSLAKPKERGEDWIEAFAAGLREDQALYGLHLLGGDSTSIKGPLSLSLTAIGKVPAGQALTRGGARPGDRLYVSGTIGDAALGLKVLCEEDLGLDKRARDQLSDRYRLPQPRLALGRELLGLASACLDVSDGLVGDAAHIAEVSGVGLEIQAGRVPFSEAAAQALSLDRGLLETLVTGGDDYELLFTAPEGAEETLKALSARLDLPITAVGRVTEGAAKVTLLDESGRELALTKGGWTHF